MDALTLPSYLPDALVIWQGDLYYFVERDADGRATLRRPDRGYVNGVDMAEITSAAVPRRARIRGDWMQDGIINNLNRRRLLDVWIEDGRVFTAAEHGPGPLVLYGEPDTLIVNADGDLEISNSVVFCPGAGELARVGIAV